MANPITGDFEAVLEISVETINRLLASLHQNGFTKPKLPSFPHGLIDRIGDTNALDGVRGTVYAQVGSPSIELIDGSTDRFWLEVDVRAYFRADPGTKPFPAFINGRVRARYRIQDIDPDCKGWRGRAHLFLWIRVDRETVTFRGTTAQDKSFADLVVQVAAAADDPIPKVTRQLAYQLASRFEAAPHPVSSGFRRGRMRSLRPAVILPLALSGGEPIGDISSVNNSLHESSDFAIRVDVDYIMSFVRQALAAIKAQIASIPVIRVSAEADLLVTEVGFTTVYRVYVNNDFTATWEDHGQFATIKLTGSGGARTNSVLPNLTFSVVQYLELRFDAGTESLTLSPGTRFVTTVEYVSSRVHKIVAAAVTAACAQAAPMLSSMTSRKHEMVDQLQTLDEQADATIDHAAFLSSGIILYGTVSLARRARPVAKFDKVPSGEGFTALLSWIPGGRIDSFDWSWKWADDIRPAGAAHLVDRFLLRRPRGRNGPWGLSISEESLPGLDGVGRVCLTIRGSQVDPVTGGRIPVELTYCRRYGFKFSEYVGGRMLLKHVPELSQDVPFPQLSVHNVGAVAGSAPNTLVLYTGDKFDAESIEVLKSALEAGREEDAGLAFLMLFRENSSGRDIRAAMERVNDLTVGLGLAAMVNEDVRGTWAQALSLPAGHGEPAWRLLSPGGGVTWLHDGRVDAETLGRALNACLFPAPVPRPAQVETAVSVGVRLSKSALVLGPRLVEPWESNCPPVHLDRASKSGTKIALVQRKSEASEAVLNKLSNLESDGEESPQILVVVDGANTRQAESMRDHLGLRFATFPDPNGAISDRFGVGIWPTVLTVGPDGVLWDIEHRGEERPVAIEHEAAD